MDGDRIRIIIRIDAIVMNVLTDMATEESVSIPTVITMIDLDEIQVTTPVVNNVLVRNVLEVLIRCKIIIVIHTQIVDHEEVRSQIIPLEVLNTREDLRAQKTLI